VKTRALALAALLAAAALAVSGCAGPAIGVVDSRRILNESLPALTYQRQLDDRERAMATDLRLLAGRLSQADLEARRQNHLRELQELKQELESRLNEQVRKAVEEVAQARRIRVVLVKEAAPIGGIDVTQDVLDHLK
jgi:outer membrane protein